MPWDEQLWLNLRRAAGYIPPTVRMEAVITMIEGSERAAQKRGASIVEEVDLVKTAVKKVPLSVRSLCLDILREQGIEVDKYTDC